MRTKTFAVFVILPVSCILAAIVVPPNPGLWFVMTLAIFGGSVLFYVIGKRRRPTTEQTPDDLEGGRPLGRFQFSLGMLLGFVTLAICLIAEITWQRQLDQQWTDAQRLIGVSDVIRQAAKSVNFPSSSAGSGFDQKGAYENLEWEVQSGTRIPDGFLNTITSKISDRLRELGATTCGSGRSGDEDHSRRGNSHPDWCGTEIDYYYGDMRGKIVLRLVYWGGKESGGFLFLDHTLAR